MNLITFLKRITLIILFTILKKLKGLNKNINSSFKILKLNKNDWLNELMDACYDCFNIKYPDEKREEIITPKYGSGPNGIR